jgi:prepilin-type N-terminal cleavage/methylation domain-containing protein
MKMKKSTTIRADGKAGFTLVEMMIVVALIGLLATIAIPTFVRARSTSQMNACINNLREIFGASQQWALEYREAPEAMVTFPDIQPYLKNAIVCPAGGTSATFANSYTLTNVTNVPTCQVAPASHILPSETTD